METVNSLQLEKERGNLTALPRRNVFEKGVLLRDVPALPRMEEYVSRIVQRLRSTLVVMKDVPTKPKKEVYV